MAFNVNNTGVILKTFFKTSTQTLPIIGYQNTGTNLTNFALYMYGSRNLCNYQQNATDLAFYFQKDAIDNCFVLGAYNMAPWVLTNSQYTNAKWIWATANANIDASGNLDGKYYWFYYSFYYNGSNTTGTMYLSCDNNAVAFFNNTKVLTLQNNSADNFGLNSVSITLIPNGLNYIRIAAYNSGYSGYSFKNYSVTNTSIGTVSVVELTISSTEKYSIITFTNTGIQANSDVGTIKFDYSTSIEILIVGGGGMGQIPTLLILMEVEVEVEEEFTIITVIVLQIKHIM